MEQHLQVVTSIIMEFMLVAVIMGTIGFNMGFVVNMDQHLIVSSYIKAITTTVAFTLEERTNLVAAFVTVASTVNTIVTAKFVIITSIRTAVVISIELITVPPVTYAIATSLF